MIKVMNNNLMSKLNAIDDGAYIYDLAVLRHYNINGIILDEQLEDMIDRLNAGHSR